VVSAAFALGADLRDPVVDVGAARPAPARLMSAQPRDEHGDDHPDRRGDEAEPDAWP